MTRSYNGRDILAGLLTAETVFAPAIFEPESSGIS